MTQRETAFPKGAHSKAALACLARGWPVVPAGERAKRPIVRWQRYQHELPSMKRVQDWWKRWPEANLAVVTGELSGIVVVDIDPKQGGAESLAAMEARHGRLPESVEAITGGRGRHIYFAHPGHEVRNRTGLAPGIDLRGDGGCIIVPPSIHPSGRRYRWKTGRAPGEISLAPLPVWIEHAHFESSDPKGHPVAYWKSLAREGVEEGRRNTTIASFAGHLLWHGVDADLAMELLLAWNRMRCRPPLDDQEVIMTVQSIEHMHRNRGKKQAGR